MKDEQLEGLPRAVHDLANALTVVLLHLEGMEHTLTTLDEDVREIKAVLPPLYTTLEGYEAAMNE